ncbi:uncharacterized protein B0I36DRAFT_248763 [Microdochium trichocladiopsis]|uniref:Rhodopsin domain-containing protein n=1 Tax=Microdochium trichocladiopsis TaxID=1682393 RepID=A0A9P8Y3Y3_9PEZI|nr:uncharacterized protein B0I36DRAFT_248763 [Microdochium trichocladiopsis]KAH7026737.1 hypothetical protein B0I36DRAFT_248763 [Microdochium trichocladiopsis]
MAVENRGPQLLGVNLLFLTLAVIATSLRCYVRFVMVKAFGLDDWLMVAATVSFIIYISMSVTGETHGTGQHHAALEPEQVTTAISYWFVCQLFYALTMIVSKVSIGYFLVRVTVRRLHAWIIWAAVAISIVAGITFFFVVLFQCHPISEYWMRYGRGQVGPVDNGSGTCLNVEIIIALAYLYSACSIVADFTLALLPAWIISSLKMDRKSKILLIPLVGMGTIASAGLVVRSPYLLTFRDPDFLYATVDIAIWSTVEQGLAITAGSLATTRPLLRMLGQKLGLATSHRKTDDGLGYSSGAGGAGANRSGASALGGVPHKHGNKSQVESYVMSSSNRTTRKDGTSWDGLDSDPEDGMILHEQQQHHHRGNGNGGGAMGGRNGAFSSAVPSSSHGVSGAGAVSGGAGGGGNGGSKKGHKSGMRTRTMSGSDSQEELQSSGLSSDNVVVTRSFLITDERV